MIILPIITLPYVARVLGPEQLGINSYTSSLTNYFVLIAVLGTTTYAQREIAYVKYDQSKLVSFFWEIELLNVISTAFSFILFLIISVLMSNYQGYFFAYSISIIANVFDISWLFMGLEKFSVLALRNFIIKIISVALIFIFVKSPSDLLVYILISSCSILISNLLLWPYVKKWHIYISISMLKGLHPLKHLKGTVALFIPQISITLYTILNKVLLGYMGEMKAGSYFDNADKIIRLTFTLLMSLSTVLMPVIATEISKKNDEKVRYLLRKSMSFSLCISIALFFGFLSISDRLVPLFLGDQYNEVILLLKIQAFIIIPMAVANVTSNQYLVPFRKTKELNISIFSGSLFNIVISIPLIMELSALGATIAILLSETLVTLIQVVQSKNERLFVGLFPDVIKYVISAIVMFSFVTIEQQFFSGWISLILGVTVGVIVYFGSLYLMKANVLGFLNTMIEKKLK